MDLFSSAATLLILTSREEDAEGLIKSLRNGGLSVSANVSHKPERLEQLISNNQFELILCCEYDPAIDLNAYIGQYRELGTDIPLVVISDEAPESPALFDALRAGARVLTKRRETDHLHRVIARELADFHHRRSEDLRRPRLAACEERSRGFIGTSGEPEETKGHRLAGRARRDGFQLVYQPIVSLRGDSQESYGVLLRLREDDGTLRDAKDFLDVASQSDEMVIIDRWIIRSAVAEVAARRAEGGKINFFVNVSEETLQEENLLIWICDCLREFQARGNWLTLEIEENHARRHVAAFAKLSTGLQKVRCRIALGRSGDGPLPESLLRGVHLDYVKLLPDLGQGLAENKSKQQRLQELMKLTRKGNIKCVATGIEDALSLTVLWTFGIDYVQGDFVQKPSTTIGTTA